MKGSATTHDGYERQDWVDFRTQVERIALTGNTMEMLRYLSSWSLLGLAVPDINALAAKVIVEMTTIIDRLTPEGSEG